MAIGSAGLCGLDLLIGKLLRSFGCGHVSLRFFARALLTSIGTKQSYYRTDFIMARVPLKPLGHVLLGATAPKVSLEVSTTVAL